MNKSALVSAILVAGLVVACGDSGAGGSGGSGGGSGGNGGNGGDSAGGTSSDGGTLNVGGFGNGGDPGNGGSTNNMSTSTGMMVGCDDTGVCQDGDDDTSNDCVSCAFAGPCSGELQACSVEPDCCTPQAGGSCGTDSFVGCIGACAPNDQACFEACAQTYPNGAQIYNALLLCAICDTCPVDCDGPGAGCP